MRLERLERKEKWTDLAKDTKYICMKLLTDRTGCVMIQFRFRKKSNNYNHNSTRGN